MAEQLPRVRDIEPSLLLGAHSPGQALQPYIPRDADSLLDTALTERNLVFVMHDSASGARRSVYEALLRIHPDLHLAIEAGLHENDMAEVPNNTVLWMDVTNRRSVTTTADELKQWLKPGRRAVIIVNHNSRQFAHLSGALAELRPTMVEISNRLSDAEQSATRHLDDTFTGDSVDELINTATVAPPPPLAAGYHADTDEGQDWLGITKDVNMLADLVVSRHIDPPLSVGLFGNWGSGKSFFMRQMRARVRTLANAATAEEDRVGRRGRTVSTYCSTVRQITFNAWHYAEANLWASLATHIFDELAAKGSEEVLHRRADELAESRENEKSLLKQLSMVRLERMLVAAQQDSTPVFPKLTKEDFAWVAKETGLSPQTTEAVQKFAEEAHGLGAEARQTWNLLRHSRLALATVGVGIVLAVGLWFLVRSPAWPVLVGLLPLLVSGTSIFARVRQAAARIRRAFENATTEREQRLTELDDKAAQLERAIADLAAQHEPTAFAKSRHESEDYRQHLGIVSQLRRDLETFSVMLKNEHGGLERVVLYIDDLDRCPPEVVVKVLEAVHLLVALPVFVVVVAVDPRWLHQAIRQHYAEMSLTPAHYLEKIFQIPFQLPEMDQKGFASLVRGLSAPAVVESRTEAPVAAAVVERNEPAPTVRVAPKVGKREGRADLRPQQLDISDDEMAFLSRLAPLVATPRAAKRMVNLYRLVRARLPGDEVEWFVADGKFQAVLVMLALHAGSDVTDFDRIEADPGWLAERVGFAVSEEHYREYLPLVRRFSFLQRGTAPDAVGGGRSLGDG
jgi:hypothetical protein